MAFWNYRYDPHWFKDARFKPDDPNEIIFTHAPYGGSVRQVMRFNLETHEKFIVYEGDVIFPSEWANDSWIVMNVYPGDIYKIKPNGDSLTQLTFTGGCFAPVLDRERTRIGFHSSEQASYIIDLQGNCMDTLPYLCGFMGTSAWSAHDEVAQLYCYGVELNSIVNCTRVVLAPLPLGSSGCGAGITYLNQYTVIWSDSQGVLTTDVNTKETRCILPTCNSSFYLGMSYDPASDRILSVRIDKIPDGLDLEIRSSLVIFNADGSNMHEIPIAW